jgi:hypothetical protein
MSVGIDPNYGVPAVYGTATQEAAKTAAEQVVEEKTKATDKKEKKDEFVKSPEAYKPDTEKINEMKADMSRNMGAFKSMVQGLLQSQAGTAAKASGYSLKNLFENLSVSPAQKQAAQQAISEDGEWGVEAVAQRIFDFAQALSGGDPAKAAELREAVKKGFAAAESAWGGKLPDISGKTYDRVMELFDEWENPPKVEETAEVAE